MQFSLWFPRLFPLPFILVGGLVLWMGGLELYNGKTSETWPQTSGQILNSSVTSSSSSSGSQRIYQAQVRYQFVVEDIPYTSDRISYRGDGSGAPSTAEDMINLAICHKFG